MPAIGYRLLGWAALIGYPVLGVSYLFNIYGAIVEAVFFIGFTAMVLLQLAERLSRHESWPDLGPGIMSRWEQIARRPAPR